MALFGNKKNNSDQFDGEKKRLSKKSKILIIVGAVLLVIGLVILLLANSFLGKISTEGNLFSSLANSLPGVEKKLQGEEEGRINILLLGMRGENVPGGGTLADTIMVVSIKPETNQVAFLSIPRDLYVDNPNLGAKSKINAVYSYGQQNGKNNGIGGMKEVVSKVVGQEIHYAIVLNFKGFVDLIDKLGGIEVSLDKPFEEAMQFNEERVCDSYVFTKPTGNFEYKYHTRKDGSKYVAATYKLCTNPNVECGGDFKLPAGEQTLSGEKALCYARSRVTSSDFDRARRQQMIIEKIIQKATSIGVLTDFEKMNGMAEILGDNLKTDLELWELKRLYEMQQKMQSPEKTQKVLENSTEGLLYAPAETKEAGYILLPIGDNYDRISQMFRDIFPAKAPVTDENQE
ncbi:MAG: LCP family protein [Candidatus Moraniibacteriota bacterium]